MKHQGANYTPTSRSPNQTPNQSRSPGTSGSPRGRGSPTGRGGKGFSSPNQAGRYQKQGQYSPNSKPSSRPFGNRPAPYKSIDSLTDVKTFVNMVELSFGQLQSSFKLLTVNAELINNPAKETGPINPMNVVYNNVSQSTGLKITKKEIELFLDEICGKHTYAYDGGQQVLVAPNANSGPKNLDKLIQIGKDTKCDKVQLSINELQDKLESKKLREWESRLQQVLLTAAKVQCQYTGGFYNDGSRIACPYTLNSGGTSDAFNKTIDSSFSDYRSEFVDPVKPIRGFYPGVHIMYNKQKVNHDKDIVTLANNGDLSIYMSVMPKTLAHVPRAMPLLDFLNNKGTMYGKGDIKSKLASPYMNEFLKGIFFKRDPRPYPKESKFLLSADRIEGVSRNNSNTEKFENGGKKVSVKDYFKLKYKYNIKNPELPLIKFKGGTIPAELVILEEQTISTFGEEIQKTFTNLARVNPEDTKNLCLQYANELFDGNHPAKELLKSWGITRKNPKEGLASFSSKVVADPNVRYHGGPTRVTGGKWNLAKCRFAKTPPKTDITVLDFGTVDKKLKVVFSNQFTKVMNDLGVGNRVRDLLAGVSIDQLQKQFSNDPIKRTEIKEKIKEALLRCLGTAYGMNFEKSRHDISGVVVLLPSYGAFKDFVYNVVKDYLEGENGIPTQCLIPSKTPILDGKPNSKPEQHFSNILMGLNIKMDGLNHTVEGHKSSFNNIFTGEGSMVIGCDLQHGKIEIDGVHSRVSYAAAVASVGGKACLFEHGGAVQVYEHDIVQDMESIIKSILLRRRDNRPIKNVLYYRDGVDWGSMDQMLRAEADVITQVLTEFNKGVAPKVSVITCLKRHGLRILPQSGTMNPQPGTIAGIGALQMSVDYPSFFLLGHQAIGGSTAVPLRCSITRNDHGFTSTEWGEISFQFCCTDQVVTKSVSLPGPTMYAHKLCERIGVHIHDLEKSSSKPVSLVQMNESLGKHLDMMPAHGYL